jgi:hypothetical protein
MKGVTYCRKAKKWRVRIGVPGERNKKINIGSYRTEGGAEEACKNWHHRNPSGPGDYWRRKLSGEKIDLSEQLKDKGRITRAWESLSSDHGAYQLENSHAAALTVGPLKILILGDGDVVDIIVEQISVCGKRKYSDWVELSKRLPTNAEFIYAQLLESGNAPLIIRRNRELILREWDNFIRVVDAPVSMESMHEQYNYDQ